MLTNKLIHELYFYYRNNSIQNHLNIIYAIYLYVLQHKLILKNGCL
jgi:hypothetical protein